MTDIKTTHPEPLNDNEIQLELDLEPELTPHLDRLRRIEAEPPQAGRKARQTPTAETSAPAARETAAGQVVSLREERVARDKWMIALDELAGEAFALAKDRRGLAAMEADEQMEDVYLKQWGMSSNVAAKIVTTIHKHRKFLREED
jgi:hypothetical protein